MNLQNEAKQKADRLKKEAQARYNSAALSARSSDGDSSPQIVNSILIAEVVSSIESSPSIPDSSPAPDFSGGGGDSGGAGSSGDF